MGFSPSKDEDPIPPHSPPFADCQCGIYALKSPLDTDEVTPWQTGCVAGIVFVWGHVLEGERGYRGQYAKIGAILMSEVEDEPDRPELIEKVAYNYQVPIITNLLEEFNRQVELQGLS